MNTKLLSIMVTSQSASIVVILSLSLPNGILLLLIAIAFVEAQIERHTS